MSFCFFPAADQIRDLASRRRVRPRALGGRGYVGRPARPLSRRHRVAGRNRKSRAYRHAPFLFPLTRNLNARECLRVIVRAALLAAVLPRQPPNTGEPSTREGRAMVPLRGFSVLAGTVLSSAGGFLTAVAVARPPESGSEAAGGLYRRICQPTLAAKTAQ
jgi:hypothetical protein